jgi:hypothetical protein
VVLFVLLCFAFSATAQNLSDKNIPQAVLDTIERELASDVIIREIGKDTEDGKTVYSVRAETKQHRKIGMKVATDGTLLEKIITGELRIRGGRLMREDGEVLIQAIHTPKVGEPNLSMCELIKAVCSISEVGANALCFDLYGFNEDGTAISAVGLDHVERLIEEIVEYTMGGICRVLGSDAPKDTTGRRNAVRAAAAALKDAVQLVYWIDGPDAEALAAEFKQIAPSLIVAAPDGDLDVVTVGELKVRYKKPSLVVGTIPKPFMEDVHFILRGEPKDYSELNEVKAYSIERGSWTSDASVLSNAERKEGFVSLFDGKTLNGWAGIGKGEGSFIVADRMIKWVKEGSGALQSRNRYGDFVLRCEYMISQDGNSGIHFRAPRANRASRIGFEVQLYGDYGVEPTKSGTGAIYDVIAPTKNASRVCGQWNTLEVTAIGPKVKVVLNSETVQNVNFDNYEKLRCRLRRGFIRLTDHGDPVSYRNIRIREIGIGERKKAAVK